MCALNGRPGPLGWRRVVHPQIGEIVGHLRRRQVLSLQGLRFGRLALETQDEGEVLTFLNRRARLGYGPAQQLFGLSRLTVRRLIHGQV